MMTLAFEMGRKAGLKEAAAYCESVEMGISPKAGGSYVPHKSICFETGCGTHAGMGYATALRTLAAKEPES
jgi:hypothetical protein